jgi:hypothetical protein
MKCWWHLVFAFSLGCSAPASESKTGPRSAPPEPSGFDGRAGAAVAEAEGRHATECARGVVARGEVVRVAASHYRGRPATLVSLAPAGGEGVVGAYYGDGPGCDLLAMLGGDGDEDVRPGSPFRAVADARRAALDARRGAVTAWALERERGEGGRWAYRFDLDTDAGLQAVFVDALTAKPWRADLPPLSPAAPTTSPPPIAGEANVPTAPAPRDAREGPSDGGQARGASASTNGRKSPAAGKPPKPGASAGQSSERNPYSINLTER